MEQLTKVFARHDYQNVMALTFLNKEADQSAKQIVSSNKGAFDDKTGVCARELTEMTNGERGRATTLEEQGSQEELELTQALALNKVKINNLTGSTCRRTSVQTPKIAAPSHSEAAAKAMFEKSNS
mgnify:CR=1 FL=1